MTQTEGNDAFRQYPLVPVRTISSTRPAPEARRPQRTRRSIAAVLVGLVALSACESDPGPRRVATDIIETESLANPELDEDCLLGQLESYTDSELEAIASDLDSENVETRAAGSAALDEFQAALESCAP